MAAVLAASVAAVGQPAAAASSQAADPDLTVSGQGLAEWDFSLPEGTSFVYSEVRWKETSEESLDDWSGRSSKVFYSPRARSFEIPRLTAGLRYKARVLVAVRSRDAMQYLKSSSIVFTASPAPAAPTAVTLDRSDGALNVAWTPASGASAYNIRCTDDRGDSWMCALGVPAGAATTSMSRTIRQGIQNSQAYTASVQGYNSQGASGFATSDLVRPYCVTRRWCGELSTPQGTPEGVTGLTVTRAGAGAEMTVTWTALSGAFSYDVYCSSDGRQNWFACPGRVYYPDTSTTVSDLETSEVYAVGVQAFTEHGVTRWSYATAASPSSPPGRVHSAEVRAHATAIALDLTWESSSGATYYEYKTYCDTSYGTPTTMTRSSDTRTRRPEYTDLPATSPIAHEIGGYDKVCMGDVRAVNANGKSAWTRSPVVAGPIAQQPPVTGISVERTSGQLAVSWDAVPHDHARDSYLASFKYRVQCSGDDGTTWTACGTTELSGIDTTTATLTSGVDDTTSSYKVRVSARGISGTSPWGDWTESQAVALANATIPSAPATLTVAWGQDAQERDALVLNWSSVSGATFYNVYCSDLGGYIWKTCARSVSTTTATITGSVDGTMTIIDKRAYWVAVAAGNSAGLSEWKRAPGIWPTTIPHAILSVSATRGDRRIDLSWEVPYNGSSPLTAYDVELSSDGGASWAATLHGLAPGTHSERDTFTTALTSLNNSLEYRVRVRAVNALGNSPWTLTPVLAAWSP